MKAIYDHDLGKILAEVFRVQGKLPVRLVQDALPTYDLSEALLPFRRRRASAAGVELAGGAGELPTVHFATPAGVLAKIERVWWRPQSDRNIVGSFSALGNAQGTESERVYTDTRLITGPQVQEPMCVVTQGTQPGAIAPIEWRSRALSSSGTEFFPPGWLIGSSLAGGVSGFEIQGTGANEEVSFCIEWLEYFL